MVLGCEKLLLFLCVWWSITTTSTSSMHVKAENYRLKVGDKLNAASKLCSKQVIYCMNLGLNQDSETLTYLQIFVQRKDDWVVWIANRNQPVEIGSAVLLLDDSGVLKIESEVGKPIILYSSPQAICWSNCSCIGFTNSFGNEVGCMFILSRESLNIASDGDDLFYILVKSTAHHKGNHMWIWTSTAIAIALLIIYLSILYRAKLKRKYMLRVNELSRTGNDVQDLEGSAEGSSSRNDLETDLSNGYELKKFSHSSIKLATNDFLPENKLGKGGFGPVFKGILPSGQEVAVKKLSETSGQGVTEFINELTLISKLQHTNLVQLIGYCIDEQERILIYEYMPNKSLDFILNDSTRRQLLDWNKRFSIIEGIAQGLLYLHKYSRVRVIHRDLKPGNILLDENMNPKISDFGVARMFTKQETKANTSRIIGTHGYMSPEYLHKGVFSTKSDVYSYGVLLLEIISGERNNSFYSEDRPLNLVEYAWELWKEGVVLQLVDPLLNELFSEDEVLRCFHAGLLCVEENADDRPTMSDVISMLTCKIKHGVLPKKSEYYGRTRFFEEETAVEETVSDSTYENSHSQSCIQSGSFVSAFF